MFGRSDVIASCQWSKVKTLVKTRYFKVESMQTFNISYVDELMGKLPLLLS